MYRYTHMYMYVYMSMYMHMYMYVFDSSHMYMYMSQAICCSIHARLPGLLATSPVADGAPSWPCNERSGESGVAEAIESVAPARCRQHQL